MNERAQALWAKMRAEQDALMRQYPGVFVQPIVYLEDRPTTRCQIKYCRGVPERRCWRCGKPTCAKHGDYREPILWCAGCEAEIDAEQAERRPAAGGRGMNLTMRCTCTSSPVQYEGTIDGRVFYFRARWDAWEFAIAASVDDAVEEVCYPGTVPGAFYRLGTYGAPGSWSAGWMPLDEAEAIIQQCAQAYEAERGQASEED